MSFYNLKEIESNQKKKACVTRDCDLPTTNVYCSQLCHLAYLRKDSENRCLKPSFRLDLKKKVIEILISFKKFSVIKYIYLRGKCVLM